MSILDRFKAKPKQPGAEETDEVEEFGANDAVKRKQTLLLGGAGFCTLVLGAWYILAPSTEPAAPATSGKDVKVATDDMVGAGMAEKNWREASEAQMQSMGNQIKSVNGYPARMQQMQDQITALQGQNQAMASDGQRVMSAYQKENDDLRRQLANGGSAPLEAAPAPLYGADGPQPYQAASAAPGTGVPAMSPGVSNAIKLVSFEDKPQGTATRISAGATSYTDSKNYLPPNSIATAKVIVGVDASAGVSSQSDPLPVVMRITGPARSVYRDGKLLKTQIEGCLVNGAARGDLSSEKVYVKLQRMTCPQANGRFAVSDVKGFISFAGKTGVRGRVVSREGSLAMQAFFAGLVGGAGNALNTAFQQPIATLRTDGAGGVDRTPSLGSVGLRALGGGAGETGRTVSKYLIERAEQYQPIIEMPTGIDVQIVFLEGVFIQN